MDDNRFPIGAESMFALWNEYPDLLPPAPSDARELMEWRRTGNYPCCHCGDIATCVLIATHRRGGMRWVDLCVPCWFWVREAMERIQASRTWREDQEDD